jgi:hypothetical protein
MAVQDSPLGLATPEAWHALLSLEKQRRGVPDNKIVFVAVRNLARVAWCPMQAVRSSRPHEVSLFQTYLEDRVGLALETGRVRSLPANQGDWLRLAAQDVPLAIVESLLLPGLPYRFEDFPGYFETEAGEQSWVEPDAPTMSWHFFAEGYVIIGEPDGLSRSEVLEAKSSRTHYLARLMRPVAELQADIYGFLFNRPRKIICQTVGDYGPLVFDEGPVNIANAIACLRTFARVESGWMPPAPAESWKCRRCDVEVGCPISRAREPRGPRVEAPE